MKLKREIEAIHEDDLDAVLDRFGLSADIDAGRFLCSICGDAVTRDNLGCLYPENR